MILPRDLGHDGDLFPLGLEVHAVPIKIHDRFLKGFDLGRQGSLTVIEECDMGGDPDQVAGLLRARRRRTEKIRTRPVLPSGVLGSPDPAPPPDPLRASFPLRSQPFDGRVILAPGETIDRRSYSASWAHVLHH